MTGSDLARHKSGLVNNGLVKRQQVSLLRTKNLSVHLGAHALPNKALGGDLFAYAKLGLWKLSLNHRAQAHGVKIRGVVPLIFILIQ